jgi:hypothetical protein
MGGLSGRPLEKQQVTIPRQSRGLSFVSRSKRLSGVANAAPMFLGHLKVAIQRHRFRCSSRCSSRSWLRMYSRIIPSSRPTVETKYPRAQKCCPTKCASARRTPGPSGSHSYP